MNRRFHELPGLIVEAQLTRLIELYPNRFTNKGAWCKEIIFGTKGWTDEQFEAAVSDYIASSEKTFPRPGQIISRRPKRERKVEVDQPAPEFPSHCVLCQVVPYEAGYESNPGTEIARVHIRIRCGCNPRQAGWVTPAALDKTEELRQQRLAKGRPVAKVPEIDDGQFEVVEERFLPTAQTEVGV